MKKIAAIYAVTAASVLLMACGSNGNQPPSAIEYGDIEDSTVNIKDDEPVSEAGLPTYDPTSATQALEYQQDRKLEIKSSYYKEQLGQRPKRAFDSIYYAAESLIPSVEFESSQLITPAELENIMHILYLDCPEIFWMDTVFSYSTNDDGYVTNVYLNYNMEADEIDFIRQDNAQQKPAVLKVIKDNDYVSIQAIIEKVMGQSRKYESVGMLPDGSYDLSCMYQFDEIEGNSVGNAKRIAYWLRECGIDCTVAIGEPISSTLDDEYELTTDYMNFRETSGQDGYYTIRYNYSCYWMWNLVKIDDKWYNLDWTYSSLLKNFKKTPYKYDTLWFVPDMVMSQTRLSYMNEEFLGIMPSCNDVNFQSLYRQGRYILPLTETQTLKKIQEILLECDSQDITDITFQCQDEQTFNYFIKNIDEQVANYNNNFGNPIGDYDTLFVRDNLTVSIYGIIYNF